MYPLSKGKEVRNLPEYVEHLSRHILRPVTGELFKFLTAMLRMKYARKMEINKTRTREIPQIHKFPNLCIFTT